MLVELLVENFAVADRVRVRLHAGLNVLSGETGSGKSLIVDSLGLLFGGRASAETVRSGAERARIAGIFELPRHKDMLALLDAAGVEAEDGELLVEREILANGKSRAFVGSKPVAASFLRELAPYFGDIHGQHDQQRLFGAKEQMAMLDDFAGSDTATVAKLWRELRRQEALLAELDRQEQEMLQKQDLWRFQKEEIEGAALQPNEDLDLTQELRILANVVRLKEQAGTAFAALSESEGSTVETLSTALKHLGELRRIDESLNDIVETLRGAEVAISDACRDLGRYLDRLEADPGRLSFVEGRLADIDKLRRKYGHSVADILDHYAKVSADLEAVANASINRGQLREQIEALRQNYATAAATLSAQRHSAAAKLGKRVERELKDLNMERSRFVISLQPSDWAENGTDSLQFLISTNLGEEAKPLDKVASGGELSRLALALKVALLGQTSQSGVRTLVFDEVDAGIGGSAAEQVGRKLKALSKGNQLLCVTHLAQIAAFGDTHFSVEKLEAKGRTHSVVAELDADGRVREVARMIGGLRLGDDALRYATQLIQLGAAG